MYTNSNSSIYESPIIIDELTNQILEENSNIIETVIRNKEKIIWILIESLIDWTNEKILRLVFPEIHDQIWFWKGRFHRWDVFDHTRETIKNYFSINFFSQKVREYLNSQIDWVSREKLLLVAMAFHDSGKLSCYRLTWRSRGHSEFTLENQFEEISSRFELTKDQKILVWNIIKNHDLPPEKIDNKIIENFLKEDFFIEYLIIAYCDIFATRWEACTQEELDTRRLIVSNFLSTL